MTTTKQQSPIRRRRKHEGRGRPTTGKTEFHTISVRREVADLARRFLLHRELETGQSAAMSEFVGELILAELQRYRAET